MSKRVDLYTFIHKAQRARLFDLAARLGRADLSDQKEMALIAEALRAMIAHLKAHSMHEFTYIHPLFYEIKAEIGMIDHEHEELEGELNKLEEILDAKNWELLYPALNRFIASYLTHQDEEETMQVNVLWKCFDDARLAEIFVKFQANRSAEQKMEDIKFFLPGLSIPELAAIFRGMKASAPPPAFQAACQIAKEQMEETRWEALNHAILGG